MPTVRSFNDTSSVSIAYAIDNHTTAADFTGTPTPFKLVPFTTESFTMQKEAKQSTAIRGSRRSSGSKNTKGSANGGVTVEFGSVGFVLDMLQATMMNVWKEITVGTPADGKYIVDGEIKTYLAVEKTARQGNLATDRLDHERYYGTAVNEATIAFQDGELITLALTTISAFADYANALAGAGGLGGSIASAKTAPAPYEIADSSNNLKNIELFDDQDALMEVTFSDASLQIQNNVREQSGLSHEFAAGIGVGKVAVSLSGEIYYFDQTMLDAHMKNKRMKAVLTISTEEGTFKITLPNLMAQTPTSNAEGENEDYKTSVTFTAEEGTVDIGATTDIPCTIAIEYVPAP